MFRQEADSQRGAIEERQRWWEAKKPFTLEEQFDESDRVQSEAALPKLQFIRQIVEVLGTGEHIHFRVRWDDEHESLLYPTEGAAILHHPAHDRTP